jgi:hypothetical protein
MIGLEYEMTHAETIDGPLGPTSGAPSASALLARHERELRGAAPQLEVDAGRYAWLSQEAAILSRSSRRAWLSFRRGRGGRAACES